MKVKVFKLPNSTVLIEEYEGDVLSKKIAWPAMLYATYGSVKSPSANLVSISSSQIYNFTALSVEPENLEIDGVPQTDGEAAVTELNGFIGNFKSGGSSSSPTDVILSITKSGINGEVIPSVFSWITDLEVREVRLMSNAAGIAFRIGDEDYDQGSLSGVQLPSGEELFITDIEIEAGENQANVIIIFKKINI
jgi:hypothetical protein